MTLDNEVFENSQLDFSSAKKGVKGKQVKITNIF
jgi:hypothetical protein